MKAFILCVSLLSSTVALAAEPGVTDAGPLITASEVIIVGSLDAGSAVVVEDAGVSVVSVVPPSLDSPLSSMKGFYLAVETGNGWLAAMFLLFFFVGALRIVGKRVHAMIPDDTQHVVLKPIEKFLYFVFDTKIGGWLLNWLSAVGGCLSTAALAGMPVDAAAWRVAIMASTGGTALIELKDDVLAWWDARQEKKKKELAEKLAAAEAAAAAASTPTPPVEPPKAS